MKQSNFYQVSHEKSKSFDNMKQSFNLTENGYQDLQKTSRNQTNTFYNKTFLSGRGFAKYGQLGAITSTNKAVSPVLVESLNAPPFDVATGESHTAIITQRLELLMIGSNLHGQLGLEDEQSTYKPTIVPALSSLKITQVSCGADHTFALTTIGEVYSWGLNLKGQLGLGHNDSRNSPTLITSLIPNGLQASMKRQKSSIELQNQNAFVLEKSVSQDNFQNTDLLSQYEKVNQIACGTLHTILKTDKNRIFSCGYGETYALGHGNITTLNAFKEISSLGSKSQKMSNQEIDKVAAGITHSACIIGGKVFIWGVCGSKKSLIVRQPQIFDINSNQDNNQVIDIALGDQLTVFLTQLGEVYVMGDNLEGQLGLQTYEECVDVPTKVSIQTNIKQISCGRNHVIVLNPQQKQAYGWGCNTYNQITSNQNQSINRPVRLQNIEKYDPYRFVCGSFHTLCLSYAEPQENDENNPLQNIGDLNNQLKKNHEDLEKISKSNDNVTQKNAALEQQNTALKEEILNFKKKVQLQEMQLQNLKNDKKRSIINQNTQTVEIYDNKDNQDNNLQIDLKKKSSTEKTLPTPRTINYNFEIDFNDLRMEKQISEGGYGLIYKARWRETVVAVKMLKIEGMNENHVRDFLSECKAMEALRHPNVCMFLGACNKPPNLSIVLEYCGRGSLWSVLQNHNIALSWDDKRRMALDTAKGVHYLHCFNPPILHRDLKSLNLLLDECFRVKLADFGWTRSLGPQMTGKIGTYQWMAPEVISNQKYTEKADVFSYGIILWEIASREPPYRNISGLQVSIQVVNNNLRPEIPKKTPENFQRLIRKCWDRDPEKRPSFREIIKDLEQMKF